MGITKSRLELNHYKIITWFPSLLQQVVNRQKPFFAFRKYIKLNQTIRSLRRRSTPLQRTKTIPRKKDTPIPKTKTSLAIIIPTLPHPLSLLARREDPPIRRPRVQLLHRSHLRVRPVRDLKASSFVSFPPESGENVEFDHHAISEFRITKLELREGTSGQQSARKIKR
jgi:hypothetical protein